MTNLNKKRSYLVRNIKTQEVLAYYRTWATAWITLSYWKDLTMSECEIVKLKKEKDNEPI